MGHVASHQMHCRWVLHSQRSENNYGRFLILVEKNESMLMTKMPKAAV